MRRRPSSALLTAGVALLLALPVAGTAAAASGPEPDGTTYTWVGSSQDHNADNHSWTDQRNWAPQGVPGNGDSVAIAPPDGSHCVAHVDAVPSGVTLQDFALSVAGFCGASVTGGSLTVAGTLTWDTGVIDTQMTVASGAAAVISGAADGNPRKVLQEHLTVDGSADLVGALVQIAAPTLLSISAGAVVRSSGSTTITNTACCVDPAHIVNGGTIDVLNGKLTVQAVQIDQLGLLQVETGAVLQAVGGPVTAADGASYAGGGRFQLWNGTKTTLTGKQTLGKGFHLELGNDGAGGDSLSGTFTLAGTGELDWTGGTISANLTVGSRVLVHAYGDNPANGRRILSGEDSSSGDPVPATLVNHGVMLVDQQAGIVTTGTARLEVASDGTLTLAPGTQVTATGCCVNPNAIVNSGGQVTVPADLEGAGPAVLNGVAYRATGGSTSIAKGAELQLIGGPQGALADTTVKGGGRLTINDPVDLSGTETLSGASAIRLIGTRGSLGGTATVAGSGTFQWQGGSLSGDLTFANGRVALSGANPKTIANVAGGSQPSAVQVSAPFSMAKAKAKHHNVLSIGSSTLTLAGESTLLANAELDGGTLVNTGSLIIDPGKKASVVTRVNLDIVNQGDVTLASGQLVSNGSYRQSAGSTTLGAGTTATFPFSSNPLTLDGGVLTGSGTVSAVVVNNAGVVDPGSVGAGPAKTLTLVGTYSQGAGAGLHIDLGTAGSDLLTVQGTASVAGTLVANNLTGYSPGKGDQQTVLSATGGLTWTVGCAMTTGSGSGSSHWEPTPGSNDLVLVWKKGSGQSC